MELPVRYAPEAMAEVCAQRPVETAARLLQIMARCGGWAMKVALTRDRDGSGDEEQAAELRTMLVDLGPSFVKVGQLMSSRVDLLPSAYITQLQTLTDRVAPFPAATAKETLQDEWRRMGADTALQDLADEEFPSIPVAAASLCQVYRLKLRAGTQDGESVSDAVDVAVKVQRPHIHEIICIDLYLLRLLAKTGQQRLPINTDLTGLVDEYGARLLAELDFKAEAQAALSFHNAIAGLSLSQSVCIARPITELTTRKVLVTEWVEGERVDQVSDREDTLRLQRIALSAYLSMLLEVGALHADPHAGNMLRTKDGRLCILDWGLVTYIDNEQREHILKYIAHILAKDYEAIPQDLVAMGFIAKGKENAVDEEEAIQEIAKIFQELAAGGSARKRIADLLPALGTLRSRYGSIAQIPNHFVYILRAFGILEGLGLRADKDYKIVNDCYPFFISWLLRTPAEVSGPMLRSVLYGGVKHAKREGVPVPSAKQVRKMLRALVAYLQSEAATAARVTRPEMDEDEAAVIAEAQLKSVMRWLSQFAATPVVLDVAADETARNVDVMMRESMELVLGPQFVTAVGVPRTEEDRAVIASHGELAEELVAALDNGTSSDEAGAFSLAEGAVQRVSVVANAHLRNLMRPRQSEDQSGANPETQEPKAADVSRATRRLASELLKRLAKRLGKDSRVAAGRKDDA